MSLIGSRTAIISLGSACQTAHQLNENRMHLSWLMRDHLEYQSSIFNWTYTSTKALPGLIRRMASGPLQAGSIHVPEAYHLATMITGHNVWLWHEKPSHEVTPEVLEQITAKYEHLRQNFLELASRPRRVFVLSDSQNNLYDQYPLASGEMSVDLSELNLNAIKDTLDDVFPDGSNQLLVMRRGQELPIDHTEWKGSPQAWEAAFSEAMPKQLAYARVRRSLRAVAGHVRRATRLR